MNNEFQLAVVSGSGIMHAGSLSHCHVLQQHSSRTEPSLMLLVTPVNTPTSEIVLCFIFIDLFFCVVDL